MSWPLRHGERFLPSRGSQSEIDRFLVGDASLDPASFASIVSF